MPALILILKEDILQKNIYDYQIIWFIINANFSATLFHNCFIIAYYIIL